MMLGDTGLGKDLEGKLVTAGQVYGGDADDLGTHASEKVGWFVGLDVGTAWTHLELDPRPTRGEDPAICQQGAIDAPCSVPDPWGK